MSTGYNKTTWQDGDIITADKMNNIENGIKSVEDTTGELKENLTDLQELADTKAPAIYGSASGPIASFKDGADDLSMKSCVVKMEPIQDLHGYDNPWPAGGGKQLLNPSTFETFPQTLNGITATLNEDGTISLSGTATTTIYISIIGYKYLSEYEFMEADTSYTLSGYYSSSAYCMFGVYGSGTDYADNTGSGKAFTFNASQISSLRYRLIIYVANGSTLSNAVVKPMICKSSATNPTTFAPYSNICPISGRTGVSVARMGKNLCPIYTIRTSDRGIDYTVTTEGIRVHGTATGHSFSWASGVNTYEATWLKVPAGTYKFSVTDMFGTGQLEGYVVFMGFDIDGKEISNFTLNGGARSITRTYTKPVGLYYGIYVKNGLTVDAVVKIQAELGSTATDYEPYKGSTYSVNWETEAGTVYGGTLDVVSGKLTVLGVKDTVTVVGGRLQSQFFVESVGQSVAVLGDNVRISLNRNSQNSNMNTVSSSYRAKMANLCPHYFAHATDTPHWYINNQLYLYLPKVDVGETLESYKTFLQDNPFEVYIQLATPTEIQLTPQEISTLLGVNNVWSDGGDISVEYPADTKMYIDQKITEAIAAALV